MKPVNLKNTNKLAQQLGLVFLAEKEQEANVCMAHSNEVRQEFRETFSTIDIVNYIYAILDSLTFQEKTKLVPLVNSLKIPFPKNSNSFWELGVFGFQIRKNHWFGSSKNDFEIIEFTIEEEYIFVQFYFKNLPVS